MPSPPVVEYALPATSQPASRLLSLDVFRGLVILAMLLVNNIGDPSTTGYFWKHADWVSMSWGQAWRVWWEAASHSPDARLAEVSPWTRIPIFTHCTLADYVMPSFMLIIGVAIPFSVASSIAKGIPAVRRSRHALKRSAMLVILGWIVCYFRDQFAKSLYGQAPWTFSLSMDVLQLLGIGYLLVRILYGLKAKPRAAVALVLLVGHWGVLRFYPQGDIPRGTFNARFNALEYIYAHWRFWDAITLHVGRLTIAWRGLLSAAPAAATMLIGTLVGDRLRRVDLTPVQKAKSLAIWGILFVAVGVLWAFDLPFNKPCWTSSYLTYVSGIGIVLLAGLYWIIDVKQIRQGTYPLVVFGTNAIALYFLSIMAKVLFLNTPRIHGRPVIEVLLTFLKSALGAWAGGWTFTWLYILFWWMVMDQMYRRRIFWKL